MLDRGFLAPHAVARWATSDPQRVALEVIDGPRLTYAQLHRLALTWAGALARLGVGAGTHVATLLPNSDVAYCAMLGLAWLRAIEVPLNTALIGELLHGALDLSDAAVLLTTRELAGRVNGMRADLPRLQTVAIVDEAEFLAGAQPASGLDGPVYRDTACLLFTSGTTGPSKAVVTPWTVVYHFWSWVPADALAPGEGLFCALPIFHNSGRAGFNNCMVRGGRYVTRDKFSATSFWDDVRATNCVIAALVGPLTSLLYSAPPRPDDDDNPLRSVVLGPMIPEIGVFEKRFGVKTATCYGQTEIGAPLTTGWDHGPWANCGRVRTDYPWPEVRIVDEWDEPVPVGAVGELVVRCAEPWALNQGYYKMPEKTIEAWRNGWFHTGDAFRVDEDGWYYLVDRLHDTIRRRGENISSFEVENAVLAHPDVVECAAFGIRTEHGDDDVMVGLIVSDPSRFDYDAFARFVSERLPAFMAPRYVEVMDDFPRNATTGRVRKNELRERGVTATTWDRLARS